MSNKVEIQAGRAHAFKDMEDYLRAWDNRKRALIIENQYKERGMLHVFGGNFCGDWLSGDGIIFWEDTDVTSADPQDEFTVVQIVEFYG